jgi:hypothetical protein
LRPELTGIGRHTRIAGRPSTAGKTNGRISHLDSLGRRSTAPASVLRPSGTSVDLWDSRRLPETLRGKPCKRHPVCIAPFEGAALTGVRCDSLSAYFGNTSPESIIVGPGVRIAAVSSRDISRSAGTGPSPSVNRLFAVRTSDANGVGQISAGSFRPSGRSTSGLKELSVYCPGRSYPSQARRSRRSRISARNGTASFIERLR